MDKNQQISNKKLNGKPMTTSASSEIFDSWTLVTDKNVPPSTGTGTGTENMQNADDVSEDTANRVEIVKTSTIANDDDDVSKTSLVEASEDLSDGISIISDSDSVGRLSPNKFLHLAADVYEPNIDLKDNDDLPDTSSVHTNVCERSSQTSVSTKSQQQQQQLLKNRKRRSSRSSSLQVDRPVDDSASTCSFPAIRCGLTSFFYVAVLLAVLAFIGKLRYPEWQPLVKSSELNELEARLIDLELQNNLLRAEFDILTKHVAYLSERNENQPRFKGKGDAPHQQPSSRRNPNRPNSSGARPGGAQNDNRKKFERDSRAWPDDFDGDRESPAFACNKETGNCIHDSNVKPPEVDNNNNGGGGDAIPNQVPPIPQPSSPDNFDDMQFSQRRNSKPSFGSGQKMGKNSFKKHGGERFDSRENFQRHEKPMKHQKPQDDYRFKKHPDQQYRHHHRSSDEDHSEDHSRERNRYHQQRRNSNGENDKNHIRDKQPKVHDNNNWYIARGDDREQARSGSGIHSR